MSSEQSFATGARVQFKATSSYAARFPGVYVVDSASDDPSLTHLEGEWLPFQTSLLEAAPPQPATATAAAPLPAPTAKPITSTPKTETAMTQTNTTDGTSKGQPPAGAVQSVDGWRAEFRASPALQKEYLSEDSYIAARKFDARRAGVKFNAHSAAEADQQDDPHVAAWMRDPALQAEFVTAQSYSAFKRAEERGSVRILQRPGG